MKGIGLKLGALAAALGAGLVGDSEAEVLGVAPSDRKAEAHELVLAMDQNRLVQALELGARLAVVARQARVPDGSLVGYLAVERPRHALAILMELFKVNRHWESGIHPSAVIAHDAQLEDGVSVGPLTVIETGARIGQASVIGSQVSIGAYATLGAGCLIYPGVRIGERVILGCRVIVHYNSSIGSDGFSFVTQDHDPTILDSERSLQSKINSNGTAIIGDRVEIGANSTIDRATLGATQIGAGTKIDNQVQIAHNVKIGKDCLICGMSGIAGSCELGDRVVLAGRVGVKDHLRIGAGATIAAGSGVGSSVPEGAVYAGYPAAPRARAVEQLTYIRRLKGLFATVRELRLRLPV